MEATSESGGDKLKLSLLPKDMTPGQLPMDQIRPAHNRRRDVLEYTKGLEENSDTHGRPKIHRI
jgi:hypothetical protein